VPPRVSVVSLAVLLCACGTTEPAPSSAVLLSEQGLIEAVVQFEGPIERGENSLLVELRPQLGDSGANLTSVDAVMPAHTHHAHAEVIEPIEQGFRVSSLDLYMTGRWRLELELELDGERDSVSMPVDVP
jgi:hypothetical protein